MDNIKERLRLAAIGFGTLHSDRGDRGLCDDAADRIEELEAALALMPDYIETFQIMRSAGRKRREMASAVAQRIDEIRGYSHDRT